VLTDSGAYWSDRSRSATKPGQAAGERDVCVGLLERREPDGTYVQVWRRELINDVSPVSALVSRDGRYVVTFDNWHSMGYGKSAIVLYGPGGALRASFALSDFLTPKQMARLPRSISSLRWGGWHHLDDREEHLVLEILERREPERARRPRPWLNATLPLRTPQAGFEVAPAAPRDGVHVLFREKSEVEWDPSTRIRTDLDCDGESDEAFLGRANGKVYVGVVPSGHFRVDVEEFAVDPAVLDAICTEPARLAQDSSAGTACPGLRLDGGDCETIHLSWEGDRLKRSRRSRLPSR
jgi:hypothetical protein